MGVRCRMGKFGTVWGKGATRVPPMTCWMISLTSCLSFMECSVTETLTLATPPSAIIVPQLKQNTKMLNFMAALRPPQVEEKHSQVEKKMSKNILNDKVIL